MTQDSQLSKDSYLRPSNVPMCLCWVLSGWQACASLPPLMGDELVITIVSSPVGKQALPPTLETVRRLIPFFSMPGSKSATHYCAQPI